MSRQQPDHSDFKAAMLHVGQLPADAPRDIKLAVFNEHFVDTLEQGDTAGYAKVEVAALLGSLRLEGGAR